MMAFVPPYNPPLVCIYLYRYGAEWCAKAKLPTLSENYELCPKNYGKLRRITINYG